MSIEGSSPSQIEPQYQAGWHMPLIPASQEAEDRENLYLRLAWAIEQALYLQNERFKGTGGAAQQ